MNNKLLYKENSKSKFYLFIIKIKIKNIWDKNIESSLNFLVYFRIWNIQI